MTLYDATQWHELFVASAGAAAALAGLVFVAVSINIERILALHGVPERALQTILLLVAVVVISIVGLVPQDTQLLGIEVLLAAALLCFAIAVPTRAAFDTDGNALWMSSRLVVVLPGSVFYLIGGASLLVEWGGGLAWLVLGMVSGIVGAVLNAWVLLVEILR